MSTVRKYPTAKFLVSQPHEMNNWRWCWSIYLPNVQGQPELLNGYGRDREHATQCAIIALHSIQNGYTRID